MNHRMEYTPAMLGNKLDYIQDRLYGIFDLLLDKFEDIDARLKMIEAVIALPVAMGTRSRV